MLSRRDEAEETKSKKILVYQYTCKFGIEIYIGIYYVCIYIYI